MKDLQQAIERVRAGSATAEEQALVEQELDRLAALEELLAERETALAVFAAGAQDTPAAQKELRRVRRRVNRKVWVRVVCCIAVLLVCVLLADLLFTFGGYNPLQRVGSPALKGTEYDQLFYWDIATYTELLLPGRAVAAAGVQNLHFGRYEYWIHLMRDDRQTGPGMLGGSYSGVMGPGGNSLGGFFAENQLAERVFFDKMWSSPETGGGAQTQADRNAYRDELAALPPSAIVTAYISFETEMSVDEFLALQRAQPELTFSYAAVQTMPPGEQGIVLGFSPLGQGARITGEQGAPVFENYPYLDRSQMRSDNGADAANADYWEQHFLNSLQYLANRPQFLQYAPLYSAGASLTLAGLQQTIEYVQQNGVAVYGARVVGSVADIQAFEADSNTHSFMIADVQVSQYAR